jgi:uncharacterized protein (TIGR02453 family)
MSAERYFTRGLFEFLMDLETHNNRDWFQTNKERHERQVQEPFLRLIADLAPGLKKIKPGFVADPSPNRGSMMRIYRDIRFSQDKSPYKTFVAAHFGQTKGNDESGPGCYLRFEPGKSLIGGGIWQPEPAVLKKIRDGIVADPKTWRRVTSVRALGPMCEMAPDSLKRPPAGYDANHPLIEDIKRKHFAVSWPLADSEVCGSDLKDLVLGNVRSISPFLQFLSKALGELKQSA